MNSWFECKVKYDKIDNEGRDKTVSEPYLVDAVSFTDAEKRVHKELEAYITGEFLVTNIKIANYSEIIPDENGDRWFKCKITYISLDEKSGKERKTNSYMLVQSNTVKEAYNKLEKELGDMVSEYSIPAIQESPILDVFPYDASESIPEGLTPLDEAEN